MHRQDIPFLNFAKKNNVKDYRLNMTENGNFLKQSQVIQISSSYQTLNPNFIPGIKPKTSRTKQGQRLKLIDYISLKNTAKQYGTNDKKAKSNIDLRKSQMKDNKAKAFNLFVKEMEKQFDIIEAVIPELKKQVGESISSDGNTSDVAKVCAIRRILKQNILVAIQQIRKLNGTQGKGELKITRKLTAEQEQEQLSNKLAQLGLSRIVSQSNMKEEIHQNQNNQQDDNFKVTVNGK